MFPHTRILGKHLRNAPPFLFPLRKVPFRPPSFQTCFDQRTSVCFLRPLCWSSLHHLPYNHSSAGHTEKAYCPVLPPTVPLGMEWATGYHIAWNEGHTPFETVRSCQDPAATQKGGSTKQPAISVGRLQSEGSLPRPSTPRSQATHSREGRRKESIRWNNDFRAGGGKDSALSKVKPLGPSYMENNVHTTQFTVYIENSENLLTGISIHSTHLQLS